MNNKLLFILFLSILLMFSQMTLASDSIILKNKTLNFDISPQNFNENSMIPLNNLEKIEGLKIVNQKQKKLIHYNRHYYILTSESNIVETSEDKIFLEKKPKKINDNFLIPAKFITNYLNLSIKEKDSNDKTKTEAKNKLELEILYQNKEFLKEETNEIHLLLTNNSNTKKTISFNSGQKFDVIIKNKLGKIVYKWSRGKRFTQAKENISLKKGESKLFSTELNLKNIKSGEYQLYGIINNGGMVNSKENLKSKKILVIIK